MNITLWENKGEYQVTIEATLEKAIEYMDANSDWLYSAAYMDNVNGTEMAVFDIQNDGQTVTIEQFQ